MNIYFMRHGECKNQKNENYHLQNTSLTQKGVLQCKLACDYLLNANIKMIYSSPKKRAIQSSEIIAHKIKCPIDIVEDITERFKILTPKSPEEVEMYNNYLNYNYTNKNFQTCKDFVDANQKALENIIFKHKEKNENILIVGHSANLYALNTYFYGIPKDKVVWMQCSNCAIIKWEV